MATLFERLLSRGKETEHIEPQNFPCHLPNDQMSVMNRVEGAPE
jgi:hypothetical protein